MSVDSPEERTVEVLKLPPGVDEELLFLYFENKWHSGGGPLVSVEKKGDGAVLVFEEAGAAAQVLSKQQHVVHNVALTVRKPPSKDRCSLLLRGIDPSTSAEAIELFLQDVMGLNLTDCALHRSPGRDSILVHLRQPLCNDFQTLTANISERTLDGAKVTLEQIEQTDCILVENLHPGTTQELLTLYLESRAGRHRDVTEITMLAEGAAKVSFVNYDSVSRVLTQTHQLEGADLVVRPYFHFLQPAAHDPAAGCQNGTERSSRCPSETPTGRPANSRSSSPMASEQPAVHEAAGGAAEEVAEDPTASEDAPWSHIPVADPAKLALFQLGTFQQDAEKTHPNVTIQVKDSGVHLESGDRQTLEQMKQSLLDYLGQMVELCFTFDPEEAEFVARQDVKERLLETLSQTGSPAAYAVSDSNVTVAALSQDAANRACSFLKGQLGHFSIPGDPEYDYTLSCREWSEFLQALGFTSVKVSERGGSIDAVTLTGMEDEKQTAILEFLSTPIEREVVVPMEPGMLKYVQVHYHQLMADMDRMSIVPLEGDGVCGLKIRGNGIACLMAEEVLQDVVSSVFTESITINAPGVTRFLRDEECKRLLKEMETKFDVHISVNHVPWAPLPQQDIFETVRMVMSRRNFQTAPLDASGQALKPELMHTDGDGAAGGGPSEEASVTSRVSDSDDLDNVDLYTAEEPTSQADQDSAVIAVEENAVSGLRQLMGGAEGLSSNLEEEAQLFLAIQHSMEEGHWSLEEEEEQLQQALELSRAIQHEASFSVDASLQVAVKAANALQLVVFAGYSCDLLRVKIAFGKKVRQKQVEEKLEHKSLTNMSEFHRTCLDVIQRKHAIEIEVRGIVITVSGFKDFVAGGLSDLKLLLEKMSNSVSEEEIYRTVQWQRHDPVSPQATPYSPDVTAFIESAWRMKLKQIDVLLDNELRNLNFETMREYKTASGKSVKISRKFINVGDLDEEVPEEESSLLSNLPEATRVDEESDEFQNVVGSFYATMQENHDNFRIIQVDKLLNRLLYNQYKLKKASILQHASHPHVERTLYHGTRETSAKEICVYGFDRSFCGENATVYGQGVYFAVDASLSVKDRYSPPNAKGHKFIFVSKVLTGDYTKGCHSMKTTPLKECTDIPLRFNSVTDDIAKPSMFVIFNDTQAYPEYLITCQRIRH